MQPAALTTAISFIRWFTIPDTRYDVDKPPARTMKAKESNKYPSNSQVMPKVILA